MMSLGTLRGLGVSRVGKLLIELSLPSGASAWQAQFLRGPLYGLGDSRGSEELGTTVSKAP